MNNRYGRVLILAVTTPKSPICDVDTPPNTLCRDEGDFTDCDGDGIWDHAFDYKCEEEEE
jgi:hypothetical protein